MAHSHSQPACSIARHRTAGPLIDVIDVHRHLRRRQSQTSESHVPATFLRLRLRRIVRAQVLSLRFLSTTLTTFHRLRPYVATPLSVQLPAALLASLAAPPVLLQP